ncbi:hypothetical protein FBU30_004422 [Linnemannia zychae]|nr:hypothetical protein FBU30_004422 [Linnemannia zychae]
MGMQHGIDAYGSAELQNFTFIFPLPSLLNQARLFENEILIVAIATLLSVAHAAEIHGSCLMEFTSGTANNPKMSCVMSIDSSQSYLIEGSFSGRPRLAKVCNNVMCVKRDNEDHKWTTVYYNGQHVSQMDPNAQKWEPNGVEYHSRGINAVF